LAAWLLVALAVGLVLGPVLRRSAEAREALERQFAEPEPEVQQQPLVQQQPPQDELQAS
jgi:hypothetical protein